MTVKEGAIKSDPPSDNPEDEGKSPPPKSSEQLAKEYKAEAERKAEEIKTLRAEKESMESELEQLKAKEEERGLSKREEVHAENLKEEIEIAKRKLRSRDDTKPWIEIAQEEMSEGLLQYEIRQGNYFIDDRAEELSDESVKNGGKEMTSKQLAAKIAPFCAPYMQLDPRRRNELGFKDYMQSVSEKKSLEKDRKEIDEEKRKLASLKEGRGGYVREPSELKKFEDAKPKERLDMVRDLIG